MNKIRVERLQKELLKIINSAFQGHIADQRLSGIDITKVKITPDQRLLKLYFSGNEHQNINNDIIELLTKCTGFIKKQIAGANIMRTIPEIVFEYDNTRERVEKIEKLFRTIAEEKRNTNYYDDDNDNEYYDNDEELVEEDLDDYDDYQDELEDDDLEFDYDDVEEEEID